MREDKWAWLVRMLAGGGAGLLAALIFVPYFMDTRLVNPVLCLLCVALRSEERRVGKECGS